MRLETLDSPESQETKDQLDNQDQWVHQEPQESQEELADQDSPVVQDCQESEDQLVNEETTVLMELLVQTETKVSLAQLV